MEINDVKPERIRIKDIAKKAGVSAGTVDRVIHNRYGVSMSSKKKVEEILRQMDYKPNMYASALATNKVYNMACLLPKHTDEDYWFYVETGMKHSVKQYNDFNVNLKPFYYDQYDKEAFTIAGTEMMEYNPDGVIIAPASEQETAPIVAELKKNNIPYVFIDSNIESLEPLTFYGQDSHKSGYFAARILSMIAERNKPAVIFRLIYEGRLASNQQINREAGFREYISHNCPDMKLYVLDFLINNPEENENIMNDFFMNHPEVKCGITFNSKAYIVGEYMTKMGRDDFNLIGYDMLERNIQCVMRGSVDFIIAQQPSMQGGECVKALFDHIILKKNIKPRNYVPITLISKENIDFYIEAHLRQNN